MKRILIAVVIITAAIAFAGCAREQNTAVSAEKAERTPVKAEKVVEIKEKLFIQQCDDIYLNPEDYTDKIIKLEGIYDEYLDEDTGEVYCYVLRNAPGCCGTDGAVGFEITFDGERPKVNDWIKVAGTIEVVKDNFDYEDIIYRLTQLEVSEERGAEFVSN